ncbi:MAG: DNA mismatch repair endonuclease MutL [Thermodesulfobacteriota bacterium]
MSVIRVLSENLANRIAAGEVVERPASVVKELVENALDAGAGRIDIHVEGDGTRSIRVIDNGCGMDEDDVLLCLERHATSKLREGADLLAIATLGFRGEAIPSIASVSHFTITSRPAGRALGTAAEVRYGRVVKVHDAGAAPGTAIEVRNLFGNVPARRKFLKSKRTELLHIEETVVNLALANPRVGFSLELDGRRALDCPEGEQSTADRFHRLMAGRIGEGTMPLAGQGDGLAVSGLLLAPEDAAGTSIGLRLFVNGRAVRDRLLLRAVSEGGHGFYMKGRRPAGVVLLGIDPARVDVNVHPAKQEVRFLEPGKVFSRIADAVRAAVEDGQRQIKQRMFAPVAVPAARPAPPRQESLYRLDAGPPPRAAEPDAGENRDVRGGVARADAAVNRGDDRRPPPPPVAADTPRLPGPAADSGRAYADIRVIGQLFATYILCEAEDGLVVIDQHAAQERLLFEKLRRQYAAGRIAEQRLLFPAVVECSPAEAQLLEQFGDEVGRLGLVVEEFGGASFLIKTVPAMLGHLEPEAILRSILGRFSETGRGDQRLEEIIASLACKASVKARQHLSGEECRALVTQMIEAAVFSHCPHGRPVARVFSREEIGKWFFRT